MAKKRKKSDDVDEKPRKKSKAKKGSAREPVVDFSKAGGGGRIRVPEGDYLSTILDASYGESKNSGNKMITFQMKGKEGKLKGKEFRVYCVLEGNGEGFGIARLREVLEAVEVDVSESKMKVPLAETVGKDLVVTMIDGEDDQGRPRSEPDSFMNPDDRVDDDDDDDDDDEEDDEDDLDDDEDDDEDDDDDDVDDIDVDEDM